MQDTPLIGAGQLFKKLSHRIEFPFCPFVLCPIFLYKYNQLAVMFKAAPAGGRCLILAPDLVRRAGPN